MFATAALGFLELGLGNVPAALAPLVRCEQMAAHSGLDDPLLIPWAPDLVEALARLGRRDDARRVAGWLDRTASTTGTATAAAMAARCHGIVAAGAGDREFACALAHHERSPLRRRAVGRAGAHRAARRRRPARARAAGGPHRRRAARRGRRRARRDEPRGAAELFLSPKTVEYHLGRAYRKLGVRGRTELAVALHTEGGDRLSAG
jgi:hypothetical protein